MSTWFSLPVFLLCLAILIVLLVRAALVIRSEKDKGRGSLPGTGDHVIDANYNSGLGGQEGTFRVPKDPDAYARRFVPKGRR
ncbi:MAG: hypothetical protein AAF871_01430 [Pseudomonadota bacterium]